MVRFLLLLALWLWVLPVWAGTFTEGVQAFEVGNYGLASERFALAIQTDDHASAARVNLCLASLLAEAYPTAIEACTAAMPQTEAYLNRGVAYLRTGQPQPALTDFQTGLQRTPQDPRLQYNAALALSQLNQAHAALSLFDQALAQTSDPVSQAEIWVDRGLALQQGRQNVLAITDLSTALTLDPLNARAYRNRGCLYLQQQQHRAAEADFDQVIALGAADADLYRDRALSRYAQGQRRAAQQDLLLAARHSLKAHDYQTYHAIAVLLLALPLDVVV